MTSFSDDFYRINKLPPYVFAVVNEMKARCGPQQLDVVDFGMGNPDGATPRPIVSKLVEAVRNPRNHRYSVVPGHPPPARGNRQALQEELRRRSGPQHGGHRHHWGQGRCVPPVVRRHRTRRRGRLAESLLPHPPVWRDHGRGPGLHDAYARSGHFPESPGGSLSHGREEAAHDPDFVSAQSDDSVRGSGLLQGDHPPGLLSRHHGGARFRLRGPRLRRLRSAQHSPGGRSQGSRRRDLLHVEELQHGGLARRILSGQPAR